MKTKIQNLVNLLLQLHKALLDLERSHYEKEHGQILDNNVYFNLVINHEDFKWLSVLLKIIARLDEESEAENIAVEKVKVLISDLKNLFGAHDNSEFSQHYQVALNNSDISKLDSQLKAALENLSL